MSRDTISYCIDDRLYLNITDRCTLRCTFCPKHNGSHCVQGYDLTLRHRPSLEQIRASIRNPAEYSEVVFCGFGESTLRLKVLIATAQHVKALGGKVRVNTDGLANLVHKRNVLPELGTCVDALSVSMNAQNAQIYARHCRPSLAGSYQAMIDFLTTAPAYVGDVTATAINGLAGVDTAACAIISRNLGVSFRERQLDIVG